MEELLISKKFHLVETIDDIKFYERKDEETILEVCLLCNGTALLRAQIYSRFDEEVIRACHHCVSSLEEHISELLMEEDYDDDEDEY